VKPANVIVPRDPSRGRAILCDFGLSKRVGAEGSITGTGALLGTPYFMAPEQVLDSKHADVRSDVFSLAMTLYFAVTGKNPFESLEGAELVRAVCSHPVPDVRTFRRDLPEALAVTLAHALHRDARARATLDELRDALREIASGSGGVPSTPASRASRGGPTSRPRGLDVLDTIELHKGAYSVMQALGPNLVEAVNDEGQVVRIERLGPLDERQKVELFRDLDVLRRFANDALVAVVDYGEIAGEHYVVSESLEDPALATYVDTRGPLTMARGVRAVSRFVRGFGAVSVAGLVHGAIGPSTLSLRATNTKRILVLSDLGIARRIRALGSPTAKRAEDPRVDVLGVVGALHFAVVGQLPFGSPGGVGASVAARPLAVTFAAPEPHVLRALEALVRKAIQGEIPSFEALGPELSALVADAPAG
jgi:serine/threonine protein kinase